MRSAVCAAAPAHPSVSTRLASRKQHTPRTTARLINAFICDQMDTNGQIFIFAVLCNNLQPSGRTLLTPLSSQSQENKDVCNMSAPRCERGGGTSQTHRGRVKHQRSPFEILSAVLVKKPGIRLVFPRLRREFLIYLYLIKLRREFKSKLSFEKQCHCSFGPVEASSAGNGLIFQPRRPIFPLMDVSFLEAELGAGMLSSLPGI